MDLRFVSSCVTRTRVCCTEFDATHQALTAQLLICTVVSCGKVTMFVTCRESYFNVLRTVFGHVVFSINTLNYTPPHPSIVYLHISTYTHLSPPPHTRTHTYRRSKNKRHGINRLRPFFVRSFQEIIILGKIMTDYLHDGARVPLCKTTGPISCVNLQKLVENRFKARGWCQRL